MEGMHMSHMKKKLYKKELNSMNNVLSKQTILEKSKNNQFSSFLGAHINLQ
jgi:hypothetical protein